MATTQQLDEFKLSQVTIDATTFKGVYCSAHYKNTDNSAAGLVIEKIYFDEAETDIYAQMSEYEKLSAFNDVVEALLHEGELLTEEELAQYRLAERGLPLENDAA